MQIPIEKFKPNWLKNKYPSKEVAILKAIALVMKRTPDALIHWNEEQWDKNSFKKEFIKGQELTIKTSTASLGMKKGKNKKNDQEEKEE